MFLLGWRRGDAHVIGSGASVSGSDASVSGSDASVSGSHADVSDLNAMQNVLLSHRSRKTFR